jgi:hypothetical protein
LVALAYTQTFHAVVEAPTAVSMLLAGRVTAILPPLIRITAAAA